MRNSLPASLMVLAAACGGRVIPLESSQTDASTGIPLEDAATLDAGTPRDGAPGPPPTSDAAVDPAPRFSQAKYIPLPGALSNAHLAVGDVNGDGRADIVVDGTDLSVPGGTHLVALLQDASGAFTQELRNGIAGALVIGDVTGDQRNDVVATGDGAGVQVVPQSPDGSFGATQHLPVDPISKLTDIHGADVDNDGRLDVVAVRGFVVAAQTDAVAFLQGGNGLLPPATYSVPISGAASVGDVNGDGRLDFVTAGTLGGGAPNILVAPGNGKGAFGASVTTVLPPPYTAVTSIAVGDVTGDGLMDVVNAAQMSTSSDSYLIVNAQAHGALLPPVAYPAPSSDGAILRIADVNGDGRNDVVIANGSGSAVGVVVHVQTQAGTLADQTYSFIDTFALAMDLVVADVNGDGKPDIVLVEPQRVVVFYNER